MSPSPPHRKEAREWEELTGYSRSGTKTAPADMKKKTETKEEILSVVGG